jgi:hypothetical protein
MNKKDKMYQQIEKHGQDLKKIFNLPADGVMELVF